MLSQSEQAVDNLERARHLRAAGLTYREVRRQLGLSPAQLGHIRRALKREKASRTRLLTTNPLGTESDLPVGRSVLPSGLRRTLTSLGYRTLGDLAQRIAEPGFAGLETHPGIGPHRAQQVARVLDHYGLLPGNNDLQGAVELLFPEFMEKSAAGNPDSSSHTSGQAT